MPVPSGTQPLALVITRNLPPSVGGMERLIGHIVSSLGESYRVAVVGPRGCHLHLPGDVMVTEVPPGPLSSFLACATTASLRIAYQLKPTLVFAGSGLTAPLALMAAKMTGAKSAVYLHGLDVEARHRVYRALWCHSFRYFDTVITNSQFTRSLAISAGVPHANIAVLNPGVGLPPLEKRGEWGSRFRQRHGLGEAPLMLYVGRITPRKGLSIFARHILPLILMKHPNARLVVVGDEPSGALLASTRGELAATKQALREANLLPSVLFLGEVAQDDPLLSEAYFAADVHVFPVQSRPGDNEGFGMVAIEAAAHGLPTVAFSAGGVPDAVSDEKSGKLISPENYPAFAEACSTYLRRENRPIEPREFAEKFSWSHFSARLNRLLKP